MKKIISIILASVLVLAMSITAFATEINQDSEVRTADATVSLEVHPTYTITIPSTIDLSKQEDQTYAGTGVVSANAVRLNSFLTVGVFLESDFEMQSSQGIKQSYTATIDGTTQPITNNQQIADFTTGDAQQSVTLNFASANPKFAGYYSDVAIFSVRLIEHVPQTN